MALPKFGVLTNPAIEVLNEINTIVKLGFDFVEIGIEGPEGTLEILSKKKNIILNLIKKHNIFAIGHTSWWIELGSEYEPVRKGWINECEKIIRLASELNLSVVNFHSSSMGIYFRYEKHKKKILENWVQSLKQLVKYSEKYKIKIMLENMPKGHGISDLKDFKYIIDRVPELKVHLDVGHAFIQGGMNCVEDYINTFENKIEHIHVHDNFGENDDHLPIGKGRINFFKVVKMLKKINYDKTMTFEVFTDDRKDTVRSREKIKELWQKN